MKLFYENKIQLNFSCLMNYLALVEYRQYAQRTASVGKYILLNSIDMKAIWKNALTKQSICHSERSEESD